MILEKGSMFNCVVLCFPVFHADIVEVKFQCEQIDEDSATKIHVLTGLPGMAQSWITHFQS